MSVRSEVLLWAQRIIARGSGTPAHVLLDVKSDASFEEAQDAFHEIARTGHPDLHRASLTPEELELVTTAYSRVAAAYHDFRAKHSQTTRMRPLKDDPPPPRSSSSDRMPAVRPQAPAATGSRQATHATRIASNASRSPMIRTRGIYRTERGGATSGRGRGGERGLRRDDRDRDRAVEEGDAPRTAALEPRLLGARIGFFGILHTWGQNLGHHPHVHFVIPGGGFAVDDPERWVTVRRPKYLLPIPKLRRIFQAKVLRALSEEHRRGKLVLEGQLTGLREVSAFKRFLEPLWRMKWVAYAWGVIRRLLSSTA